jgi:hypothetical protein
MRVLPNIHLVRNLLLILTATCLLAGANAQVCSFAPAGTAAWWEFQNTTNDVLGISHLSLFNGATYGVGKVGQGLSLDGVNDYARVNPNANLNIGTNAGLTIELWVKCANAAAVGTFVEWNNGSIGAHIATSSGNPRDVFANIVDTSGISHQVSSGANVLSNGVFLHVAFTYDRTSGLAAMYLNGAVIRSTNLGIFTPQTTYPFYVGNRPAGPVSGTYFPGIIDELTLYGRVLTANEVQAIYLAGAAGKCASGPLAILSQPQSLTVAEGSTAGFSVTAQGIQPLLYAWRFNGGSIGGQTNSQLNLTNVQQAQAGGYSVVVSDTSGSLTSSVATLTVTQVPLAIITQPQNVTVQQSNNASFTVVAQGTAPLQYQWRFNGSNLTNQTLATLNLNTVQTNQAGGYSVVVSDISGSITSTVATLTVTLPPNCGSIGNGLVAWWKYQNSGTDSVGTATMTLVSGATYGIGEVGQGLLLNGSGSYSEAAASGALHIGASSGMTIEAWIKPSNAAGLGTILEWNNGSSGIGLHISTSTTGTRDLYANLVDTGGTSHQIYTPSGALVDNTFQHFALTYEKTTGLAALYLNGSLIRSTNLGIFTPQTSYALQVGIRKSGAFAPAAFPGVVDELSLYSRVLAPEEISSIYATASLGKCSEPQPLGILVQPQGATVQESNSVSLSVVAQGTPPIQYQWFFTNAPLAGRTNSVLNLTNVQLAQAGDYFVQVTDATGTVASAVATLIVIQPLAIVVPPQNAMVQAGVSLSLSVTARGTPPLAYQWLFNGAPMAGQTSSNLVLAAIAPGQAGRYSVVVSNFSGTLTSPAAIVTVLSSSNPLITEFMAENDRSLLDEDGEAPDWIEVFNPGLAAVNLENWSLTDNATNLTKWRFLATNIASQGYLLVFASAKDRRVPGAPLHTNFRLANSGGYLALVMPDGITIASEWTNYPAQRANVSYGLSGGPAFFPIPTPGAANNSGVLGYVADTKFSTNRGFFFAPFNLTLHCTTPGATIVYTTNGNIPTLPSSLTILPPDANTAPTGTIQITATTTLRAAAFKEGYVPTDVDTHTYVLPATVASQTRPPGASSTWIEDPPGNGQSYPADFTVDGSVVSAAVAPYSFTNALQSIPTISLVTPMDGIFGPVNGIYTHPLREGTNWERRTSVELIYPDGREGFHVEAGVQIHGAVSELPHATPKHPFRILFREEYGMNKFEFPLFPGPVNKFDQLVLRACSTDSWPIANEVGFLWYNYDATYLRDQWMRDAHLAMNQTAARGLYVQLFVNGLYWGLYNLTEKLNDTYFADRLGGQKEEYDVITDFTGVAVSGTRDMWTQLLSLSGQAAGNPNIFTQVQGQNPDGVRNTNYPVLINMDNFIDYMLLHIHGAAIDWPGRNWWAARRRGPLSDGFRFFTWDQEVAIDRLDRDSTGTWGVSPTKIELVYEPNTVGQVYDGLRRDAEFKVMFGDRVQQHMFNGGVLTLQSNVARWAARSAEIDHAIVGESARWGDAQHSPAYNRQADWLVKSNFMANTYFPSNAQFALKRFRNVGLYPNVGAPAFSQFGGDVPQGFTLGITQTNVGGTIYFTTDGNDPRLRGGAVSGAAQTYSEPVPIAGPTVVRARVKVAANWSALVEALFIPPQDFSKLQLSEIMYNPPKVESIDGDEFEFLEFKNIGSTALDLTGLVFSNGINFTFTNDTFVSAGQYFVLARNATQFAAHYPGAPLHGLYSGKLDNAGERLALFLPSGASVLDVTYDNAAPWPTEADNSGLSLQRMNFIHAVTNAAGWIAASPTPGSPPPGDFLDSDGDGMADGWENFYHLDPEQDDGAADFDYDGFTNWQEFIAGTDPTNPTDWLRLQSSLAAGADGSPEVHLEFTAVSNKTYTVLWSDAAFGGAWSNLVHLAAAPTNRLVVVTNAVPAPASGRFYRLTTPRRP